MASILVIDDEPLFRETVVAVLTDRGHTAFAAENGRDAEKQYKGRTFDLIITDLVMPEMDGFEVLRQNRVAGGKVPIIAISGNPTNDHFLRMARMLGARHTLTKPISADLLISTVNETLAVSAQK